MLLQHSNLVGSDVSLFMELIDLDGLGRDRLVDRIEEMIRKFEERAINLKRKGIEGEKGPFPSPW